MMVIKIKRLLLFMMIGISLSFFYNYNCIYNLLNYKINCKYHLFFQSKYDYDIYLKVIKLDGIIKEKIGRTNFSYYYKFNFEYSINEKIKEICLYLGKYNIEYEKINCINIQNIINYKPKIKISSIIKPNKIFFKLEFIIDKNIINKYLLLVYLNNNLIYEKELYQSENITKIINKNLIGLKGNLKFKVFQYNDNKLVYSKDFSFDFSYKIEGNYIIFNNKFFDEVCVDNICYNGTKVKLGKNIYIKINNERIPLKIRYNNETTRKIKYNLLGGINLNRIFFILLLIILIYFIYRNKDLFLNYYKNYKEIEEPPKEEPKIEDFIKEVRKQPETPKKLKDVFNLKEEKKEEAKPQKREEKEDFVIDLEKELEEQ